MSEENTNNNKKGWDDSPFAEDLVTDTDPSVTDETATAAPDTDKGCTQGGNEDRSDRKKEKDKDPKRRELQRKIDQLAGEKEALADALAAEKDRYARMLAEYENFRKRSQKEKDGVYSDAYADALGEIMPMVDNLERALGVDDNDKLHSGLEMVMNQFTDTLKKLGIESYGEKGETFDPNIHHAIMHEEDENQPENTVCEVFQRGYRRGEKIIRCAMVKVVN